MTFTVDEARGWHMREDAHYNGGEKFFAYMHRCVEQPRLSRFDKYLRKDRSVTSTWRVDGEDKPSFEAAIEALNVPPEFRDDELALLRTFGDEPEDRRKEMFADMPLWNGLKEKGAIGWRDGRVTITEAGRDAISTPVYGADNG